MKMAGSLKESLANAEGFIRAERFSSLATEGKLLSMSVWENEECVSKWRNFAAHRMAQKHGRMNDFADYKITVVTPVRSYTMTDRTAAPADSMNIWRCKLMTYTYHYDSPLGGITPFRATEQS